VAAIVLAAIAALVSWRRPVVLGLLASAVVSFFTIYQLGTGAPVQKLLSRLGLSAVAVQRMQSVLELVVAILAALGLEEVVERWRSPPVRIAGLGASVVVLGVLAELWSKVATARLPPGAVPPKNAPSIAMLESLRRSSLIWPTASIALVLALVAAGWVARRLGDGRAARAGRLAAFGLLAAQSSFLLFAGVGINSYSEDAYPVTPAVAALRSIVGTKLLALDEGNTDCDPATPHDGAVCGVRFWRGAGFYPVMNIAYGIDELAMHDPTIPQAYFDAWPVANAGQVTPVNLNLFAPAVGTVALARRYGAAYVLVLPGVEPPAGMRLVATVAGEKLFAVPGASRFSFVAGAGATVVSAAHPGDARYVIEVHVTRRSELAVRITGVAGWNATADGRSIPVERYDGALMSVELPAGTRTVVLDYRPRRFTEGLVVAAAAVAGLVAWALLAAAGRRRRPGGARLAGAGRGPGGARLAGARRRRGRSGHAGSRRPPLVPSTGG
jgi:hypothetical protein